MKKLLMVLAVALSAGVIPAGANGEGRLGKFRIRDPFVLVDGGLYYLFVTLMQSTNVCPIKALSPEAEGGFKGQVRRAKLG